jgi:hypothetical protein
LAVRTTQIRGENNGNGSWFEQSVDLKDDGKLVSLV